MSESVAVYRCEWHDPPLDRPKQCASEGGVIVRRQDDTGSAGHYCAKHAARMAWIMASVFLGLYERELEGPGPRPPRERPMFRPVRFMPYSTPELQAAWQTGYERALAIAREAICPLCDRHGAPRDAGAHHWWHTDDGETVGMCAASAILAADALEVAEQVARDLKDRALNPFARATPAA